MAKRKKARRTNRNSGINVLNVIEAYMLTSVATRTLFNVDPATFVIGNQSNSFNAAGQAQLSLAELFKRTPAAGGARTIGGVGATSIMSPFDQVKSNLQANWIKGASGFILIPLAFKLGKKVSSRGRAKINRGLKDAGLKGTVKV
jgi:hypothetical protein